MGGGGWVQDFTKLMLNSTQVEDVAEVGVELGKKAKNVKNAANELCMIGPIILPHIPTTIL